MALRSHSVPFMGENQQRTLSCSFTNPTTEAVCKRCLHSTRSLAPKHTWQSRWTSLAKIKLQLFLLLVCRKDFLLHGKAELLGFFRDLVFVLLVLGLDLLLHVRNLLLQAVYNLL